MRWSNIIISTLAVASAAPTFPDINLKDVVNPDDTLESLSDYFNTLATRVQLAKVLSEPPICDVSAAKMPESPDGLPGPSNGLKPRAITVGRGTQNYTCTPGDASAEPKAAGAYAHLFDASCIASLYPDLLTRLPAMALRFNLSDPAQLGASPLAATGMHFFTDSTTPYFNLGDNEERGGEAWTSKEADAPAPSSAAVGQKGESAVAWLKLSTKGDTGGNMKEVFRVSTAGGSPPATCEGMEETFEVEYATVYWFWAGDIEEDDE